MLARKRQAALGGMAWATTAEPAAAHGVVDIDMSQIPAAFRKRARLAAASAAEAPPGDGGFPADPWQASGPATADRWCPPKGNCWWPSEPSFPSECPPAAWWGRCPPHLGGGSGGGCGSARQAMMGQMMAAHARAGQQADSPAQSASSSRPRHKPGVPATQDAAAQEKHDDNESKGFTGRIKGFYEMPSGGGGGYGFIDCSETKIRFGRDVYIHARQMHGFRIGDSVSFTVVRNQKGEPQARNVMRIEDAVFLRAKQQGQVSHPEGRPQLRPESSSAPAGGLMDEEEARRFQRSLKENRL